MQRKWKKAVAALTVAALGMTTFAGCGGSTASDGSQAADTSAADGQVTIKFVHKFPEDKRMQYFNDIVAEFEEKNPNIKVEMTSYGDEEIKDKTRVLLGSADAPDIFFTWSGERITQYVDSGNAMDISKYLEDDSAWKDSFNQTMLETCNKNGSYWAIPWDYSSKEIVYNKQVFANAGVTETPKTWDEFLDVCEKIKASGVTPIALGNQYSWVVCHYITTLNGKLVPQDTIQSNYSLENTDFTDAGYAKALDMMKELLDKGYVNTDVNSCTWEMSESMVQEGTAGMMLAPQCSLIPIYKMLSTIGLYNTRIGMLIPYIAYRVPFSFFLMWSFMLNLPVEVEEAAIIDGCSIRQVFFNIVLKMSKPVIATTAVMSARYIWNDFAFALVFSEGRELQTVPLAIFAIRSTSQTQWGVLIAGLTLAALPMVVVYICLQQYFVDGMNSGAVKG